MNEKSLEELMQMDLEERWIELLSNADDAIKDEELRIRLSKDTDHGK